ncbi:hypothetical protein ABU614_06260 [Lysobacter firmicutimachus]|uniref:Uncharacterized protein n=1 Tax=Lysobacter firmicutimachus TaxID=1792846 RepID=A0AAU8MVU3_9GAMM
MSRLLLRCLWYLAASVVVPANALWLDVVDELDAAWMRILTPEVFLGELALLSLALMATTLLPGSLLLLWRQRRRGPRRHDRFAFAAISAASLLLALHANLTDYARFYGNTWGLLEPTFGFFLPQWPWITACVAVAVALELRGGAAKPAPADADVDALRRAPER